MSRGRKTNTANRTNGKQTSVFDFMAEPTSSVGIQEHEIHDDNKVALQEHNVFPYTMPEKFRKPPMVVQIRYKQTPSERAATFYKVLRNQYVLHVLQNHKDTDVATQSMKKDYLQNDPLGDSVPKYSDNLCWKAVRTNLATQDTSSDEGDDSSDNNAEENEDGDNPNPGEAQTEPTGEGSRSPSSPGSERPARKSERNLLPENTFPHHVTTPPN